jgi:DNA-binding beta-propeller fold protein YncE
MTCKTYGGGIALRKLVAVCMLLLAASAGVAGADPAGIPGASGTIFVTERTTSPAISSLTAFDAAPGDVLWTSPTGPNPIGVTKPHGTGRVYTSDENANRMSVFDAGTGAFLHPIPMGSRPHHLTASRDGNFVYVGEFGQNTIGVVDTSIDTAIAHYVASANPSARTHAVWISNDGKSLYATNAVANTISKLEASTGTLVWELPNGNNPSEILVTPDDKLAYVSVRNEHTIKVVDVSGEAPVVIGQGEANSQPDTLSLTNDGNTLVVGLRTSPSGRARAGLIDTATLTTRYVEMPAHTTTGHQWLSANGKFTFMAVETPGAVAVIDNAAGAVVDEYPYPGGGSRPHGVFYVPDVLR